MTFLTNKHIIFYRTIDVQEIEVERILGVERVKKK
jgi:hypothetical protein